MFFFGGVGGKSRLTTTGIPHVRFISKFKIPFIFEFRKERLNFSQETQDNVLHSHPQSENQVKKETDFFSEWHTSFDF